ncbi:MAG: phytanoyl-CoA dioxygenase family protein [Scytonema hyalinum WJT4-NPBG1]|jgi:hypothetical protein|nr:phytanoyl-CoA dioxygenase family protein [Scytonema hyalinum WJT4-NPBG1]
MVNNERNIAATLVCRNFWAKYFLITYQYLKKRLENPEWFLMVTISRFKTVPLLKSFFVQPQIIEIKKATPSLFDIEVDDAVESLKKDSFSLGLKLPESIFQEILQFANSTDCYGNGEHHFGFSYIEKEKAEAKCDKTFRRGDYFNSNLLCPAIKKLAKDPKLLEIATKYLGGVPVHTGSRLWWLFSLKEQDQYLLLEKMRFLSLQESTREGAYFFHYDLDDYQFLKFFFYLTDVDVHSGAHVCVRGSHKKKKLAHLLSFFRRSSDEEIADYYGAENVVPICGEAGFGSAEDTFCFHKAMIPSRKDRLMLQIQFALKNYGNHNDLVEQSALKRCF